MLRQELPEAIVLWEKRPHFRVPQMHWALAALAGVGMQWLSLSLLRGVLFASASFTGFPPVRTVEITELISWAVATVIAIASAGSRGVIALVALGVALEAVRLALALPGAQLFCERSGRADCAIQPLLLAATSWPVLAGVAFGVVARGIASRGRHGRFALALGASIVVIGPQLVLVASVPFVGPTPTGERAHDVLEWYLVAQSLAAFAMGVIAGRWGDHPVTSAAVMSGAYLLTWIPYFAQTLRDRAASIPIVSVAMWQAMMPLAFAAAAVFGLVVGVTLRKRAESAREKYRPI
jgi:hypothetical protein